jgi:hypothetical protein
VAKAPKKSADQPDNVTPIRNGPAEDAVLALNVAKLMAADILFAGAKDDHKAIRVHVEAKGVNLKAYAWADKIIKAGDVGGAVELIEATLKILKIRGRPATSSQLELLTSEDDRTPLDERAAEEGRYAGIMGFGDDANPYGIDSAAGQAWQNAYNGGCEERKLILSLEPSADSELIKGADNGEDPFADPAKVAAE